MKAFWIGAVFLGAVLASEASSASFSRDHFAIALGAQYNSLLQKRGIITYEGQQLLPIFSAQLFHPRLLLAGSALYYTHPFPSESSFLRVRLNFGSTPDRPLFDTAEEKVERVQRESSSELDLFYELRSDRGDFIRLQLSQDLVAHQGLYSELYVRLALGDFIEHKNGKPLLQPGLFASVGGGDRAHNEYLYGEDAGGLGLTNLQYGFSVTSPSVIDLFWPTLQITRFELLGSDTQGASYVRETSGYQVEALAAFRVF